MIFARYINGNVKVTIAQDGTKTREYVNTPYIVHPESIDLKITNYCDLGCSYCHESSTKAGKHADLDKVLQVIEPLPAGAELAIGGGNPLSHPKLNDFLQELKQRGIIANLTVNQGHVYPHIHQLKYLIKSYLVQGIGISIVHRGYKGIQLLQELTDNIVYHLIAGVNPPSTLDELISFGNAKALILGYKKFGFGVNYYDKHVEEGIQDWYRELHRFIGKAVLSFDNLAIEQLNVKRLFTDTGWKKFYMGDDFTYTMYIDGVNQQYAPTSRSPKKERVAFDQATLLQFFAKRNPIALV